MKRLVVPLSLAALAAAAAIRFAPLGADAGFLDLAHDGYQLREVLDLLSGARLFRDTFDQYGPLAPLFNVTGFLLFGHTLLAVKYFIALWYGATAWVLYAVSRHLLDPMLSAGSVLAWLVLAPFYQQGVMISPHAYASMMQAGAVLSVLAYLRAPRIGFLVLAGALAGATCLLKQSIGALLLASLVLFLAIPSMTAGDGRATRVRWAAVLGSCGAVLAVAAVVLLARGALHDWYLQTIAFPRAFYLSYYGDTGSAGPGRAAMLLAIRFVELQLAAEPIWLLLRLVAIGGALAAIVRRDAARAPLVLAGCVTAVLWLGAFPSATGMHQWWTAMFAVPAAIAIGRDVITRVMARWSLPPLVLDSLTALLVVLAAAPSAAARERDAADRVARLSAPIVTPPILAGIRTDPVTARSLATLYQTMSGYRAHHPGALVASIDEADGISGRVAESLPLLSILADNRHPSPIYWRLPVLSTAIYPDYDRTFADFVRSARPLLVDARRTGEGARGVAGYYLLAAEPSPSGHWLLYAPDHAERIAHGEPPTALDDPPLPPIVEYVTLASSGAAAQARAYVWPPAATISIGAVPWSRNEELGLPKFSAPQLQRRAGTLMVDGPVDAPYSYLLHLPDRHLRAGEYFYAQGDLLQGGLTIGLQSGEQWVGAVNVVRQGRFAVMIAAPRDGDYALVIANCVSPSWWQRVVHRGRISNAFRIDAAGWAGAL